MKKIATIFILLITFSLIPSTLADGMIIPPYIDRPEYLTENSQIAAINYEDGLQKMIISVNFDMGSAPKAAWIFPIPAEPEKVVIDIVKQFPKFSGYDVVEKTKSDVDNIIRATTFTQIYPIFPWFFFVGGTFTAVTQAPVYEGTEITTGVTVYEHLEKEGITTEIVTSKRADTLYNYLRLKGLNIQKGSIPVIDEYIGKDYTFVISWITPKNETIITCTEPRPEVCTEIYNPVCGSNGITYSNGCYACRNSNVEWYVKGACDGKYYPYRQPGVFITFPTDKIYYPLLPTSVYGSETIPITIYVLGYVEPEVYDQIKTYTKTNYYVQRYSYNTYGLEEFYGNTKSKEYTKIEIKVPSKYLTEDIWITEGQPAKVGYANLIYSTISSHPFVFGFLLLIIISSLTGTVTGFIIFKDWKKYAIIGLANIFTIIGLIIAIAFTQTRKVEEGLKRKLKQEGLIVITSDFWKSLLL